MDMESEITRQHEVLAYQHEILGNISDYQYKRIVDNQLYMTSVIIINSILVIIMAVIMSQLVNNLNEEVEEVEIAEAKVLNSC